MRNIILVALAGLASAGIFMVMRRDVRERPAPIEAVAEAADRIALRWASEDPALEGRVLTFALSDSYEGTDSMELPSGRRSETLLAKWFSSNDSGVFLRAMEREADMVVWPLGRMTPEDEKMFREPFARILVKAGASGARVRVIAHGNSSGFAARAAAAAARGRQAGSRPVLDRLTGVGINAELLRPRYPQVYSEIAAVPALGEWINIWADPSAIARSVYVEHWLPASAAPAYDMRPWGSAAWPAIVTGVSTRGLAALPNAERIEVAPSTRPSERRVIARKDKEERGSGIDMLAAAEKKNNPMEKEVAKEKKDLHQIGSSGWMMAKLEGFRYMTGGALNAYWSEGMFRIDVMHISGHSTGFEDRNAHVKCSQSNLKMVRAKHLGRPVEICNGVPGDEATRPNARSDYFTITAADGVVTLTYTYPSASAREQKLKKFMAAIEAMEPAATGPAPADERSSSRQERRLR